MNSSSEPFHLSSQQGEKVRLQVVWTSTEAVPPLGQLSPASLAYIGDAVYELYIRTHYLWPPKRLRDHHSIVVATVRAESQADSLAILEPYLTDKEREILRWGRNAATGKPKRLSQELYQKATSLETLIGYLYLHNPQRLHQILEYLNFDMTTDQY